MKVDCGRGLTVTVICDDAVQPVTVPTIVYVIVDVGFAVTEEPVVLLKPVAGLHEYVLAPLTVRTVD